jgi:hypothetical protein
MAGPTMKASPNLRAADPGSYGSPSGVRAAAGAATLQPPRFSVTLKPLTAAAREFSTLCSNAPTARLRRLGGRVPSGRLLMKIQELSIGMKLRHPEYGDGIVQSISNVDVSILFGNILRTVDPELTEVAPAEALINAEGESMSQKQLIEATVETTLRRLGVESPNAVVEELGTRWHKGKVVLVPSDPNLQSKEIPLEIFFHKIVGIRNQLRVLEQKVNSNEKLSDAEKFDIQQYITRSYGSLTTLNILFKSKEDQFSSKPG